MQQAAEVDLDRLVDYKTEYCSVIKKHKITGDNLTGLCPFHDDRANSFSVDLKTGMWHCFAEDEGGNFVTFYAKLNGLDTKEAYKQILEKYGALNEPQEKPKEKKPGLDHYTVSQYSFEKRLPEDWLKEQCCLQTKKDRNGVQYLYIPYFDAEKNLALHRKRYGGKQFRWEYGKTDRLCMYGLWQIEAIRNIGYAALVEGESDSQSMWYMGISTLGIPGASMMRADWAGVLQDLKLYIHVEPDKGGEAFLAKVTRALREGKFVGEVYKWSCRTLGCKDPSEVYMKYGKEEAAEKIRKAISNAEQIDIEEDNIPEAVEGAPVNLKEVRTCHGMQNPDYYHAATAEHGNRRGKDRGSIQEGWAVAQGNLPTKYHLHIQSHHSTGRLRMHRHIGECKAHRKILGSTGSREHRHHKESRLHKYIRMAIRKAVRAGA